MDLAKLPNNEIIKLCARDDRSDTICSEFVRRFDQFIRLAVIRECQRKNISHSGAAAEPVFQDLIQDVYYRLFEKNCKAFKNYKGESENSIFLYLMVIVRHTVINHLVKSSAQKRPVITRSLDEPVENFSSFDQPSLLDLMKSDQVDIENEIIEKEEILYYLNKIISGKNKDRDMLIFKLFVDGFLPEDIASQFNIGLSAKRVSNIISAIKQELRIYFISHNLAPC